MDKSLLLQGSQRRVLSMSRSKLPHPGDTLACLLHTRLAPDTRSFSVLTTVQSIGILAEFLVAIEKNPFDVDLVSASRRIV